MIWCGICGLSSAQKHSCLWCLVYDNAPVVHALRTDYLQRCCHLAFGCIIKMGCTVYVRYHVFPCASSVVLCDLWLQGWVNISGQPFLVILSWPSVSGTWWTQSLRSSQNPWLFSHLYVSLSTGGIFALAERRECNFYTRTHAQSQRKDALNLLSLPHNAENPSLKGG